MGKTILVLCLWAALATNVAEVQAGCSGTGSDGSNDPSPEFIGTAYPTHGNARDGDCGDDNGGLGCAVGIFGDCGNVSYYLRFTSDDPEDEFLFTNTSIINLTCQEALGLSDDIEDSEFIPANDSDICCDAFRFRQDEVIEADVENVPLSFTIEDEYGNNSALFMELCEELWACSSYQTQLALAQCEANNGRNCPDYVNRSLCFNEAYAPGEDETAERGARAKFILEFCYGAGDPEFDFDSPEGYSIDELQDERDSTCNFAEDTSNSLFFTPADAAVCDELIECLVNNTNQIAVKDPDTGEPAFEVTAEDFEELKSELCAGNLTTLQANRNDTCNGAAGDGPRNYTIPSGNGPTGCLPLPTCPNTTGDLFKDFGPGYPSGSEYEAAIATIRGKNLAIENGLDDRTTSDYVGLIGILRATTAAVVIATETFKDSLPSSLIYFFKVPPYQVAKAILLAFDTVYKQAELHDGLVDSAEIEAIYENTRQMLDGSAAIYDEVVCRCAENGTRRGQGCDSIDNNCDQVVDELDEDNWPPEIDVGQALCQCGSGAFQQKWFLDNMTAIECVTEATEVEDDCDQDVQSVEATLIGTCGDARIELDAMDRSNNSAVTATVPVLIDTEDPEVSCSVGGEGATAIQIRETGPGVLENVQLQYNATDNCGGDLDVKVDVYANEIEDFQSQEMALFYKTRDIENDVGGLYVATKNCPTASNGQCIKDPNLDLRLYTIVVSATDPASRVATPKECTVLILRNTTNTVPDISQTTQRFLLTSYSSVFEGVSFDGSTDNFFAIQ